MIQNDRVLYTDRYRSSSIGINRYEKLRM